MLECIYLLKLRLTVELIWPLLVFLILAWVRSQDPISKQEDCHLIPKAMPSIGGFEFLQNFFCTWANPCFSYPIEDTQAFENSKINRYFRVLSPIVERLSQSNKARTLVTSIWHDISRSYLPTAIKNIDDEDLEFLYSLVDFSRIVLEEPEFPTTADQSYATRSLNDWSKFFSFFCGLENNRTEYPESLDTFIKEGFGGAEGVNEDLLDDESVPSECKDVVRNLTQHQTVEAAWKLLKPIIRGDILYFPENNFTSEVMRRVDLKIEELKYAEVTVTLARDLVERWLHWTRSYPERVNRTKEFLYDPKNVNDLLIRINITDPEQVSLSKNFLRLVAVSNWNEFLQSSRENVRVTLVILKCFKYNKRRGFKTEEEALESAAKLLKKHLIWALIDFNSTVPPYNESDNTQYPAFLQYKIRMDSDRIPSFPFRGKFTKADPPIDPLQHLKYSTFGFLFIQEFVETSIVEIAANSNNTLGFGFYMTQFPFPCFIYDHFIKRLANTFPLLMVVAWIFSAAMIVKSIVYEKENYLREMMKVMGMGNIVTWLGWFIDSFTLLFVSATVLTIILKFCNILPHSDWTLLWTFNLSFAVSVICFCFLVSTFFNKANSSAAVAGVLFFLCYLPYTFLNIKFKLRQISHFQVLLCCLLSNTAFGFGCNYIVVKEDRGFGATWQGLNSRFELHRKSTDDEEFDLDSSIIMLWVDSLLYFLIALYVEAVWPGSAGIPLPWYFLFIPSTYIKIFRRRRTRRFSEALESNVAIEAPPEDLTAGVEIRGLSKTYSNRKVALKNLNIDFYENQITSFLGHNGAGKTTTMSILVGLFPPSKGTAYISGVDITKDVREARKYIGICPQHNVLFSRLTVAEHIRFFAGLKGNAEDVSSDDLNNILQDLGIPEKKHEFPNKLSGGMKRKLCVAISFAGGTKTVLLDEPTAGVDPYSRRSIWDLLLKYKEGRTIVLSTHFMDEADILGDRIAIISRGMLKACGSSLFLKNTFGEGYSLHLVRKNRRISVADPVKAEEIQRRKSEGKNKLLKTMRRLSMGNQRVYTTDLLNFVKAIIPQARLVSHIGTEVCLNLPQESSPSFSRLFSALDDNLNILAIDSYGISDTSLEDVFLKVTYEDLEEVESDAKFCSCLRKRRKNYEIAPEVMIPVNSRIPAAETTSFRSGFDSISSFATQSQDIPQIQDSISNVGPEIQDNISNVGREIQDNISYVGPEIQSLQTTLDGLEYPSLARMKTISTSRVPLWIIQIKAILVKRFTNSVRSLKSIFFEVVLPVALIAVTLLFITGVVLPKIEVLPIPITMRLYDQPHLRVFFSQPVNQTDTATTHFSTTEEYYNDTTETAFTETYIVETTEGDVIVSTRPSDVPRGSEFFDRIIAGILGKESLGVECLVPVKKAISQQYCFPELFNKALVSRFHRERRRFSVDKAKQPACECTTSGQKCYNYGNFPPHVDIHSRMQILDVSKYKLPEWLIKTYYAYYKSRSGGYEFLAHSPYPVNLTYMFIVLGSLTDAFSSGLPVDVPPNEDSSSNVIRVWFQANAYHSPVAFLNALNNVIMRDLLPVEAKENLSNITGFAVLNHPLPLTADQIEALLNLIKGPLGLIVSICAILALSFVPASFTLYLIEEKSNGAKHLHLVSGVKPVVYWLSNFIHDLLKYTLPVTLALILFIAFDIQDLVSYYSVAAFALLLVLYGWAIIPLMYTATYVFSVPSTAFVFLSCANLFIGVVTTVSEYLTRKLGEKNADLDHAADILGNVFLIFPQYCLGKGMITLTELSIYAAANKRRSQPNRFFWSNLGKFHTLLFISGVVYLVLVVLIDYREWFYAQMWRPKPLYVSRITVLENFETTENFDDEDEDVHEERERVTRGYHLADSVLVSMRLTKFYSGKKAPAVRELTFAMDDGECFGLLGINGAGKTTTFKMLTGDTPISGGMASISGFNVVTDRDQARKNFGYCPQEDGLDPLLNAYEILKLYGKLRGMNDAEAFEASDRLIRVLGLKRFATKRCGTFSGGNKRKLSTAIALIGDPTIVFLDEPSSGMDPRARRQLWKVVLYLLEQHKAVVLTTHSMEECEALCTRLGIMVNGTFVCLGSTHHLKSRFGSGYVLSVRCLRGKTEEFQQFMEEKLPAATMQDTHGTQVKYKIPQEVANLSGIFDVMLSAKEQELIEDYSVSQTTLDDIFVKFASLQEEEVR